MKQPTRTQAGMMPIEPGTLDGWMLAPECAAVHTASATAVIADVHLGYEWARARHGDVMPDHSLRETLDRLTPLFNRTRVTRLIVAGDLVESAAPCPRTRDDVEHLVRWLEERGARLCLVQGNHDAPGTRQRATVIKHADWTIAHGHRPVRGRRVVMGHLHPILKLQGASAPCFLIDSDRIVLPAFSRNAAGLNVLGNNGIARSESRCVVALDNGLLDFGTIAALRKAARRRPGVVDEIGQ